MHISECRDYMEMSQLATDLVRKEIKRKPDLLLCAATGSSPEGLYRELGTLASSIRGLFSKLRILKLDEWGGIPENHPASCEHFIRNRLLVPLGVPPGRYISFRSDPEDPEAECQRIRSRLENEGPIDICILGLGANGHLALNEPAARLQSHAHVATLSERSLQHSMISAMEQKPTYGLTLGMDEILSSRKIIMLLSGKGKKQIAGKFLEGNISPELPASYLWKHSRVECLLDRSVLA